MITTWLWDRKMELMTFPDFLQWKPVSERVNDSQYLCGLHLGEVPYDGIHSWELHTGPEQREPVLSSRSQENLPQDHTNCPTLCCKPSSSLYHLCRLSWSQPYSGFQPIHLDTSFPFLHLTITTHFPSWKVSPVNLLSTSAFQSCHFSIPEDNGQWDSPAALSSCVVWQRSLQLPASCSVLSGYDHCHQHLRAKPFLVSTENIQNVTVKSWKWYKTVLHLGFKS